GDARAVVNPRPFRGYRHDVLLLPGEADRLAADRVVLAQRVALPVVVHQDPGEVGVALGADAHQVPGLAFVPVGGRPDWADPRHRLAVVEPDPDAHALPAGNRQEVVV